MKTGSHWFPRVPGTTCQNWFSLVPLLRRGEPVGNAFSSGSAAIETWSFFNVAAVSTVMG